MELKEKSNNNNNKELEKKHNTQRKEMNVSNIDHHSKNLVKAFGSFSVLADNRLI